MAALTPPPSTKRKSRKDSESTLSVPKFIPSMQPTLVDEPPAGGDWLHEIKYDGYRTQLAIGCRESRRKRTMIHQHPSPKPKTIGETMRRTVRTAVRNEVQTAVDATEASATIDVPSTLL